VLPFLTDCSHFLVLAFINPYLGLGYFITSLFCGPHWFKLSLFAIRNQYAKSRRGITNYLFKKFGWRFLFSDEVFKYEVLAFVGFASFVASAVLTKKFLNYIFSDKKIIKNKEKNSYDEVNINLLSKASEIKETALKKQNDEYQSKSVVISEGNIMGIPINIPPDIKPVYEVNRVNIGHTTSLSEKYRLITLKIFDRSTNDFVSCFGTLVSSQVMLIPAHFVRKPRNINFDYPGFDMRDGDIIRYEHVGRESSFIWNYCNYYPSKDKDFAFVYIGSVITFPNTTTFVSQFEPLPDDIYVGNERKINLHLEIPQTGIAYVPVTFSNGDCSRPIIDGRGRLLGIHVGSQMGLDGRISLGSRVTLEDYEDFKNRCRIGDVNPLMNDRANRAFTPQNAIILEGVHPKSDMAWFDIHIGVIGHVKNTRTPKMTCHKTMLYDYFKEYLDDEYVGPNPKHAKFFDGEFRSLYKRNIEASEFSGCVDDKIMNLAMEYMTYTPSQGQILGPVSLHQAIVGSTVNTFMAPRDDSKGIGSYLSSLNVTKEKAIEQVDKERSQYRIHPTVLELLNTKLALIESGEGYISVCDGVVKDECLKLSDVNMGKGRLFFVSCLTDILITKMYLTNILTAILTDIENHDCYASINVCGADWLHLYNHLTDNGKRTKIIELDQSKFDVHHSWGFVWYKVYILRQAIIFGYSKKQLREICTLLDSLDNKIKIILNIYFMYVSTLCSGRADTIHANSIIQKILFTYCFIMYYIKSDQKLPSKKEFRDILRMAFVGDDCLLSVPPQGYEWFNGLYVRQEMLILGYEVTAADKHSLISDYKDISEVTFLKRRFRWDGVMMLAPLNLTSIYKGLCFAIKSTISDKDRSIQVLEVSQYEMFMHGKEKFNEFERKLEEIKDLTFRRFSYDDLLNKYLTRDFKSWAI
jgi:hypothetical protein